MDHLALFVSSLAYSLWLIRHPARASTTYLSAFSYSPQVHTPKYRPNHPRGSPSSWLSSPTASPESIPLELLALDPLSEAGGHET